MAVRLALWLTHGSWLLIQITEVIRILKFAEGSCKVLGHWLTPSWQPQGLGLGWHTGHRALTLLLTLTEAGLAMLAAWWCVLTMFYLTECVSVVWTGLSSTSEWLEWAAASSGRPSPGWRGQAVSPEPHQARPGRREIAVKVFTVLLSHPAQPAPPPLTPPAVPRIGKMISPGFWAKKLTKLSFGNDCRQKCQSAPDKKHR